MKNGKQELGTVLILPVLGNASKEDEGQARSFPYSLSPILLNQAISSSFLLFFSLEGFFS